MADLAEWMTPMDRDILELLERSKVLKIQGLWLKPGTIAININRHRVSVSNRLAELLDHGMVERDDSSFYRITDKGSGWINGQIDAEQL